MNEILLINPEITGRKERLHGLNVPAGLMYVGSYLFHNGYSVNILDVNNMESLDDFYGKIKHELSRTMCVGLSVMTAQLPSALKISDYIRQFNPSIPIIWGGMHPTLFTEQTVKHDSIDFAVKGEGEVTTLELVRAIEEHKDPVDVKGIAFKPNAIKNKITVNPDREYIDMNNLPPVEWDLLTDIRNRGVDEMAKLTMSGIPIQTSRGCPHRCTFCINTVLKNKFRCRRSDLVVEDIKRLVNLGVDSIYFIDENFFTNKKRVFEIVDGIEKNHLNIKFFANIRADYLREGYIDFDLLKKLKKGGCERVSIGAESGSQKILDTLKKDITVDDILNSAKKLSKAGIKCNYSFMIGLPDEHIDDIKKTLRLIEKITKLNSSFWILGPQIYRPYPGSQLYFECLKLGMKEPTTLSEWANSQYIQREITPEHQHDYPWIEFQIEDLNNIIFCAQCFGLPWRFAFINNVVRRIASIRCENFYFKFFIERKIYGVLRRYMDKFVNIQYFGK